MIRSARKVSPAASERTISAEQTFTRARGIAAAKGVTRLADITGLDRIGIPVYSAIVPKSLDSISVYNGKGPTAIESRTGALMEAIERQTVLYAQLEVLEGSYSDLRGDIIKAIDPASFSYKLRNDYNWRMPYWWVVGYDLVTEDAVRVPAGLASYGPRYGNQLSPYQTYSTDGLASGNCFEEAVCHACCELIERDAWTLAELRSQWIPWAKREAILGREAAKAAYDDGDAYPRIDLTDAGEPIVGMIEKFSRAGLYPIVRDITSDFGIPCVIAAIGDESVPGFPQAHGGVGAHPNARIAVTRALGELAQSRAVDIQGVREDLLPAGATCDRTSMHTQRVQKIQPQRWLLQERGAMRPLAQIVSIENDDIADDIALLLSRLTQRGIQRVIVVDFTEPGSFSVVRVLIPGLEFWSTDHGKLGERAMQFWRQHI